MPNISFSKSALQEFRFCHDPYVYQGYPSVVLGRKVKYLNEFLDTKLSEKTNFKTSEGVPAKKTRVPSKIWNMVITFHVVLCL